MFQFLQGMSVSRSLRAWHFDNMKTINFKPNAFECTRWYDSIIFFCFVLKNIDLAAWLPRIIHNYADFVTNQAKNTTTPPTRTGRCPKNSGASLFMFYP